MYIIYAVRRIGFFVKRHIEQGESEKGKTDTEYKWTKRQIKRISIAFYLLNRKTGLGILDFKGLVSPVCAVTGAGITGAILLLLPPPVAISPAFLLSPHSDSHFCFSDENSSTFVSVLLLFSGCCCCCCCATLFDFLGDRPECCD